MDGKLIKLEDIPPLSLAPLVDEDRRYWERMMEHTDAVRWALIDLIRVLNSIYGAQSYSIHTELARIAKTLGVELPVPPDVDEEVEV